MDFLRAQENRLTALQRDRLQVLNQQAVLPGTVRISFRLDAREKRRQAELLRDENRFNQFQNLAKIYPEFDGSATVP
ncbi:hypothetical protein VW41_05265 [Klebsiella michiganensis]|nr:hypothetical protein VW41_05265 [Klebsiella michiganensis]